ncbi:hypothetical protein COW91_01770 [Candidatus Nomurabacteria bacterium CG22_combo_CG10-13_8_21_14_all_32_8]|uniref:Uncharacterized protein n=2 Tax=Candidatus Nomuraibacteriota TaxID=1752729 RepID=A0A2H0CGE3_9BACT|nr:MAG: hypothetical protein COW91_01770 [Candidatus Nomurabacteria bacterium CG22_combo_CG10-13_8_21_14_all_32_8]PIZ86296.1 MAG: hypothetical protein COX94_00490 [Candidatus Nomurabacteria bacterium CG_4_10_14_0_2_um_filter_33_9]
MLRILALLVLLVSIFYMPFWLSIILALTAMIYFSFFWEGVILFFISDLLYGIKEEKFFNIFFVSFIISFLVLIVIELLKKKIRISN